MRRGCDCLRSRSRRWRSRTIRTVLGRTVVCRGEWYPSPVSMGRSLVGLPWRASRRIFSSISRRGGERGQGADGDATSVPSSSRPPSRRPGRAPRPEAVRWMTTLSIRHRSSAFFCSCENRSGRHHSGIVSPARRQPSRLGVELLEGPSLLLVPSPPRPASARRADSQRLSSSAATRRLSGSAFWYWRSARRAW